MTAQRDLAGLDQVFYQNTKMGLNGQSGFQAVGSSLGDDVVFSWAAKLHPRAESEQPSLCYLRYPGRSAALIFRSPVQGQTRGQFFAHALIGSSDELTPQRAVASIDWHWTGALRRPGAQARDRDELGKISSQLYGAWADERWDELTRELPPVEQAMSPGDGAQSADDDPRKFVVFIDPAPQDLPVLLLAGLILRANSARVIGDGFATHERTYIGENGLPRFVFARQPQRSGQNLDRIPIDLRGIPLDEGIYVLAAKVGMRSSVTLAEPAADQVSPDNAGAAAEPTTANTAGAGPDTGTTGMSQTAAPAAVPANAVADNAAPASTVPEDAAEDVDPAVAKAAADPNAATDGRAEPTMAADGINADSAASREPSRAGEYFAARGTPSSPVSSEPPSGNAARDSDPRVHGAERDFRLPRAETDYRSPDGPPGNGDDGSAGYTGSHRSGSGEPERSPLPSGRSWDGPTETDQRVTAEVAGMSDAQLIRSLVFLNNKLDEIPAYTRQLQYRAELREAVAQRALSGAKPDSPAVAQALFAAYQGELVGVLTAKARSYNYGPQLDAMFTALAHLMTADTPLGTTNAKSDTDYVVALVREQIDPALRQEISVRVWQDGEVPYRVAQTAGPAMLKAQGFKIARPPQSEHQPDRSDAEKQRFQITFASMAAAIVVLVVGCLLILSLGGV